MLPAHRTGWGTPFVLEIGRTCLSASDPFSEESPRLSVPFGAATDSSLGVSASARTDRGSGTASRWKNVPIERQIRTRSYFGSSWGRIRNRYLPPLLTAPPQQGHTHKKPHSPFSSLLSQCEARCARREVGQLGNHVSQTPPLGEQPKASLVPLRRPPPGRGAPAHPFPS